MTPFPSSLQPHPSFPTLKLTASSSLIIIVSCVYVFHKYTNIASWVYFCCLCVYGLRADHSVLNNHWRTDARESLTPPLPVVCNSSLPKGGTLWKFPPSALACPRLLPLFRFHSCRTDWFTQTSCYSGSYSLCGPSFTMCRSCAGVDVPSGGRVFQCVAWVCGW